MSRSPARARVLACLAAAGTAAAVIAAPSSASAGDLSPGLIRLNQVQVIGSHNSYHYEPNQAEKQLIASVAPDRAGELKYSHPPISQQLDGQHVRQIELDVYADPDGGRYATPLIRGYTQQPPAYDPAMKEPGTKVLHISDIDYHSNCALLTDCLRAVRHFSRTHPSHVPIAILIEFKDQLELQIPGVPFVQPLPWTRDRMLALEQEIRSVFTEQALLTPDDVRTPGKTLEQTVTTSGWPSLSASRGKVMFLMDNGGDYRSRYVESNPSLQGRVLFTSGTPGQPDAAFIKRNDAVASKAEIAQLVGSGYMVRTRADAATAQARSGDTSTMTAALASGAQWVSTDYPVPGLAARFGTGYYAALPEGATARCNPVSAPSWCHFVLPHLPWQN